MMINYLYDGSFEGLLTSIYEAFYAEIKPTNIVFEGEFSENFLVDKKYIKTDEKKAKKVYDAIEKKISPQALRRVFYSHLSELLNREIYILRYLQIGFKIGSEVDLNLADENVLNIDTMYKLVSKERHRMTGFIRFKKIKENLLYAHIQPDHNIVSLIANHFKERLRDENFIIHDTKRQIGVIYNRQEWIIRDMRKIDIELKDSDMIYEELWKKYFQATAIKGKENSKLQRKNMPKRYWSNLTEKS
jgi:probable DNA metabolism protein